MTLTISPESLRSLPEPEYSRLATALTPRTTSYIPADHLSKERLSAQQRALLCLSELLPLDEPSEVLYGGSAGGGKTDALLMAALQYADVPGYAALILRRTFKQLALPDAAMARSHDWLHKTDARWRGDEYTWTFASGATLTFGHLQHEESKYDYQGAAFQFVGFDELTQFTESQYVYLHSRTRRLEGSQVPIRVWSTSNPGGIGHGWVRSKFIDGDALYIPARLWDNQNIDQLAYEQSMSHLPKELRQQLLEGNWDAFEGQAYVVEQAHLIDSFALNDAFDRYEAADYGFNGAPWALCATDFDGNLVFVDMLYEKELLPSELCPLVLAKRKGYWGVETTAYMDPSVWHRTGTLNKMGEPLELADEFSESGVPLVKANNDPRAGMARLRELLRLDLQHRFPAWHPRYGELGAPRVFFTEACQRLVDELRSAPLQPLDKRNGGEIVDPEWESRNGHAAAMARYAAMVKADASEEPEPYEDDPRKRHVLEMFEAQRQEDEWVDEGELDPTLIPSNWN